MVVGRQLFRWLDELLALSPLPYTPITNSTTTSDSPRHCARHGDRRRSRKAIGTRGGTQARRREVGRQGATRQAGASSGATTSYARCGGLIYCAGRRPFSFSLFMFFSCSFVIHIDLKLFRTQTHTCQSHGGSCHSWSIACTSCKTHTEHLHAVVLVRQCHCSPSRSRNPIDQYRLLNECCKLIVMSHCLN